MRDLFGNLLADGGGFQGWFVDGSSMFWSAVLRTLQAMIAAAPYLMCGVLFAGIIRGMIGPDRVRKWLGVDHWTGPLRAWALGVLLPICSLGALPVARELRRAGIPSGTVLSFVLVAPVLNPATIIFGLSYVQAYTIFYFVAGTFFVSIGIGTLWNRVISLKQDREPEKVLATPASTWGRLTVVGDRTLSGLIGPETINYALALLAVALMGAFLPYGVMQTGMTTDNVWAPLVMSAVAIPAYVTPTDVMMHFSVIVRDGYSLGAAFALIILGAGANVGVANWIRHDYGFRAFWLFVILLIGITLVIGFTADRTLAVGSATVRDHTHAFDTFTRPSSFFTDNPVDWIGTRIRRTTSSTEAMGAWILLGFSIAGLVILPFRRFFSTDSLMVDQEAKRAEEFSKLNPALSTWQVMIAGLLTAAALSIAGLFVFYPPAKTVFAEIRFTTGMAHSAILEKDGEESKRYLQQMSQHARKLKSSHWLRTLELTEPQIQTADELIYAIEEIHKSIEDEDFNVARLLLRHWLPEVMEDARHQFLPQLSTKVP